MGRSRNTKVGPDKGATQLTTLGEEESEDAAPTTTTTTATATPPPLANGGGGSKGDRGGGSSSNSSSTNGSSGPKAPSARVDALGLTSATAQREASTSPTSPTAPTTTTTNSTNTTSKGSSSSANKSKRRKASRGSNSSGGADTALSAGILLQQLQENLKHTSRVTAFDSGNSKNRDSAILIDGEEAGPSTGQLVAAAVLNSSIFTGIMISATVYALFADDLRVLLLPPAADLPMSVISVVVFVLFIMEISMQLYVKQGEYFGTFYFYLDVAATVSMVIPILGLAGIALESDNAPTSDNLSIAKAGRAARASARSARFMRVLKLLTFFRRQSEDTGESAGSVADVIDDLVEPSEVGKRLIAKTTKKVVIGVLLSMVAFTVLLPRDVDTSRGTSLADLVDMYDLCNDSLPLDECEPLQIELSLFREFHPNNIGIVLDGEEFKPASNVDPDSLREESVIVEQDGDSSATYNVSKSTRDASLFNLFTTLFVIVALSCGNYLIARDAQILVITPIERMTKVVHRLATDPLSSLKISDEDETETGMLLLVLRKIGGLLQIAFGEAGAGIIAHNMANSNALDPMVPGRRVDALFAFCDIRKFTDTTELLQEYVMLYVNHVARIVHGIANKYGGAPNKNVGDAFLLMWRLPSEVQEDGEGVGGEDNGEGVGGGGDGCDGGGDDDGLFAGGVGNAISHMAQTFSLRSSAGDGDDAEDGGDGDGAGNGGIGEGFVIDSHIPPEYLVNPADRALAFIEEALEALKVDAALLDVCEYIKTLPGADPNGDYSVKLGFGLHAGWAIEGGIGSALKVDASYLSSNVNLADTLEATTKKYGVPILMSHTVYDGLCEWRKERCRKLDCIKVSGEEPITLYTPCDDVHRVAACNDAVELYIRGDWTNARKAFTDLLKEYPDDGPVTLLLGYIQRYSFSPPMDWKGVRPLNEVVDKWQRVRSLTRASVRGAVLRSLAAESENENSSSGSGGSGGVGGVGNKPLKSSPLAGGGNSSSNNNSSETKKGGGSSLSNKRRKDTAELKRQMEEAQAKMVAAAVTAFSGSGPPPSATRIVRRRASVAVSVPSFPAPRSPLQLGSSGASIASNASSGSGVGVGSGLARGGVGGKGSTSSLGMKRTKSASNSDLAAAAAAALARSGQTPTSIVTRELSGVPFMEEEESGSGSGSGSGDSGRSAPPFETEAANLTLSAPTTPALALKGDPNFVADHSSGSDSGSGSSGASR